ncbi:MAG: serine hydrolase domain-containing protein [Planctomycetota bacterium]|nr:serine hydrolase domain-containing protein [Planctomycetota bacterium]
MRATALVLVLALLLAGHGVEAVAKKGDSDEPIVAGKLGKQLDAAIEEAAPEMWGSVLVARKGKILLARGYGNADYASAPNTPRTLHELASISKQVTATAVLHLVQRKKLKLDAPIGKYFKKTPGDKEDITVRQLLTHTSGISGNVGVPYDSPLDRKSYLREILAKPLATQPGERFEYANVNYALAAALVEEVSKKSFEAYCEKHLFKPAGCKDTGFIQDKDLEKSGRASSRKGAARGKTAADWHYGWGYRGMGGVVATVLDVHRWDRALRSKDVLKDEFKDLLYEPVMNFYACGWKVNVTDRGTRKVHHSGGVQGYGANLVRYLEDDVLIVALSNDGKHAFDVTRAVERVLFEPVSLKVSIDVRKFGGGGKTVRMSDGMAWAAKRKGKVALLRLTKGKETPLEVEIPRGTYAKKLVQELEQSIASREADDDGQPAKLDAELHLRGYGPAATFSHEFGMVDIEAEFRAGQGQIDRRVTLILRDSRSGGWAGFVKMNLASAKQLLGVLKK